MRSRNLLAVVAASLILTLVACGGGADSGDAAPAGTTINGAAVKGPVEGAKVTVRTLIGPGSVLGTATTGPGGVFSVGVQYAGDVLVEVTGGTYIDEATGVPLTLTAPMRVVLTAAGGNVTGMVTPLTTMAYAYARDSGDPVTAASYNAMAERLARQFQLGNLNLVTSQPIVSGLVNDYGRVLAALSNYLHLNDIALQDLMDTSFTTTQWGTFLDSFTTIYASVYPNHPVKFTVVENALNMSGTGAGGGTGVCGVHAKGFITANGVDSDVDIDYCVTGIAKGSCVASDASMTKVLGGQNGVTGAANLVYTFSPTCAVGAFTIKLK